MSRPKRWNLAPPHPAVDDLARRLKTSPVLAQLLLNRGLSDTDDCLAFLKPSLMALHDPGLIPNLSRASQRVARAIHEKQKIVIFGDYDVDGITGTTILWHAIRTLGGNVQYYIPHRIDEGYGLNREAVVQLCDAGAGLIITVDCGITESLIAPFDTARFKLVQGYTAPSPRHQGRYHTGEDWSIPGGEALGQPIIAAGRGKVRYSYPQGWGRDAGVVILEHRMADDV